MPTRQPAYVHLSFLSGTLATPRASLEVDTPVIKPRTSQRYCMNNQACKSCNKEKRSGLFTSPNFMLRGGQTSNTMLQQRLLRQGRRDQLAGDELPGGGLPVRRRLRPERDAGDIRRLLRRAPVRDAVRRGSAEAAAVLLPLRRRSRRCRLQLPAAARRMKAI